MAGTSAFASLEKEVHLGIKLTVGLISVVAAVLPSLQTFLRFSEKADQHRATAARAGSVGRIIETTLVAGDPEQLTEVKLNRIREMYDEVSSNAPSVPDKIRDRVASRMKKETA